MTMGRRGLKVKVMGQANSGRCDLDRGKFFSFASFQRGGGVNFLQW